MFYLLSHRPSAAAMNARDPKPIAEPEYGRKFKDNRYSDIDPRPPSMRKLTRSAVDDFCIRNHAKPGAESNWIAMKVKYDEYILDQERTDVLKELRNMFLKALAEDIEQYSTGNQIDL
jgi:hypothetical protein